MRLSFYLCLFILNTGFLFAVVHHDCGGTIDILQEKSGHIQYSLSSGQAGSNVITELTHYSGVAQAGTNCTWVIEALPNQKVRLEVVSVDHESHLWVHFEGSRDPRVYVPGESTSLAGIGRTIINWRAKPYGSSQQSIHIFFTDRKEIKNSLEWGSDESPQTAPAMYTEISSANITGAPGVWRKSWLLGSSGPTVGSGGNAHRTMRARGQGAAFHSLTPAPTLWLGPGTSALSDKEAPRLPQEAAHNNPDTSGAALPVSHISSAPDYPTDGSGRRAHAAGLHQPTLPIQTGGSESWPPLFLDASTGSAKHAAASLPPTHSEDATAQGSVIVGEAGPGAAPLSPSQADSVAVLPGPRTLPPHMTLALAPASAPPGRQTDAAGEADSHTLTPTVRFTGSRTSTVHSTGSRTSTVHSTGSRTSTVHSKGSRTPTVHSKGSRTPTVHSRGSRTSTLHFQSALSPFGPTHSPTAHLSTTFTGSHSGKDSTHINDRRTLVSDIPGTGGEEVTEWSSVSASLPNSTLDTSEGQNGLPESTGTVGRGSRSVTHLEPVVSSVSEGLTNKGLDQGLWVTGTAHGTTERIPDSTGTEGSPRLSTLVTRSLSEGESSDVLSQGFLEKSSPMPGYTDRPSTTELLPSVESVTPGGMGVSTDSTDPGNTHSEMASVTNSLEMDLHGSSSNSTASLLPELGKENKVDFTVSVPSSGASTHSPVDQHFTETQTAKREFEGSASPNDIHLTSVSVTAFPEVSPWPESERHPAHTSESSNSTSRPVSSAETDTRVVPASFTTPAALTAGPQGGTTESEDMSSASHTTPDHLLEGVTTSTLPHTTFLNQGTRGPESLDEGTHTNREGHSDRVPTSTSDTLSYFHRYTTTPTDSGVTSLSMTSRPSSVALPTARPSPALSSTVGGITLHPTVLSVSPHAPQGQSTSVPDRTRGARRRVGCPECTTTTSVSGRTSSPLVTSSSAVVGVRTTTISSRRTTNQTPVIPLPLTPQASSTSQAPRHHADPLPPRTAVATSTAPTQTPTGRVSVALSSTTKPVRGRVFIMGDQPAIIKEDTFQLLLQIILENESGEELESPQTNSINADAAQKVEPLLQRAPGYEGLQVPWTSGRAVLQSVPVFSAVKALSWLGIPGGLLDVTGLREVVREGLYLGGAKVVNITVGGLQADLCSWLFLCPSGFQCVSTSTGNASCTSLCHTDYCKNNGICTHHHGQQPMCQCPVGEDFWFMGRQCDLRMTRQRLVGVCLGVLLSVVVLMVAVSFLAVRRIKAMLIQAKVDQTRSSYRRFNHFDELSGRFWLRSWPGSADSLDNPGFSRSDELLHLRALDRTCCYHDDTLSIASTCPESGTHLNTIYTHGSHYNWNVSENSINEWMADSGKASDLSVCSWPIEPIQWTPFPLLQQLGIHRSAKTPRPHSYCEGMELVDLEKTWTA